MYFFFLIDFQIFPLFSMNFSIFYDFPMIFYCNIFVRELRCTPTPANISRQSTYLKNNWCPKIAIPLDGQAVFSTCLLGKNTCSCWDLKATSMPWCGGGVGAWSYSRRRPLFLFWEMRCPGGARAGRYRLFVQSLAGLDWLAGVAWLGSGRQSLAGVSCTAIG